MVPLLTALRLLRLHLLKPSKTLSLPEKQKGQLGTAAPFLLPAIPARFVPATIDSLQGVDCPWQNYPDNVNRACKALLQHQLNTCRSAPRAWMNCADKSQGSPGLGLTGLSCNITL
jgi:hypothetical protein